MKIYLVRHGHAVKRAAWTGWDDLRPLTARGERQARGLKESLASAAFRRIWSSPAVRCHATVEPLAGDRAALVELDERLGEQGSAKGALALLEEEARSSILLCASRSLIHALLSAFGVGGTDPASIKCQKGSVWVLDRQGDEIVSATYLPPQEVEGEPSRGRRLSVLDIGSASMSLLVADVRRDKRSIEPVLRERAALPFGSSLGEISAKDCERCVQDARAMWAEAASVGCEEILPVATAGLRNAPNGQEVAAQIGKALDVPVRMLSGAEEARLVYTATRARLGISDEAIVAADLGGGSLDLATGSGPSPAYEASEALGASRLHAQLVHSDPMEDDERHAIRKQVRDALRPHLRRVLPTEPRCVVAGGTVRALARLVQASRGRADLESVRGLSLSRAELAALALHLCGATRAERIAMPAVRPRRADTLPTGAIILVTLLEQLELSELTVSDWGLREGVLLERAESADGGS